ncbi:MAG: PorP/SprF family type IX secretion system membrane protein [Chitinophagales bacterium]|nr:PorP/SprF family type IX secretion system membrane protein [Chitinophagales bacterium]
MKRFLLTLCSMVLLIQFGQSQDFHWSLYHLNPMYLNPAFTGFAKKKNRVTALYRDQWRSVIVPYSTLDISYDRNVYEHEASGIQLGVGGQLIYDKSGDGGLTTYRPALSLQLGKNLMKKTGVSLGINLAYVRQQIDFTKFVFDNQYEGGLYNPQLPNGETLLGDNASYFDFGIGVNFNSRLKNKGDIDVGVSFFNINSPQYGFLSGADASVLPRTNAYAKANVDIGSSDWSFHPGVYFQNQNKAQETLLQSIFGVKLGKTNQDGNKDFELQFGPGYRINDAVVAYAGLNWKDLKIGFAFDGNTSDLKLASNRKGAYEIGVNYIWEKNKKKEPEEFESVDSIPDEVKEDSIPQKQLSDTIPHIESIDSISGKLPLQPSSPDRALQIDSITNYLSTLEPIQLFFANDYPNPRTRDTLTSASYKLLFDDYLEELVLIKNGENPERFIHQVEISMLQFNLVLKDILILLESRQKVQIALSGFASPLSNPAYNTNLSKRRISSIVNYLQAWNNDALKSFIENNQLEIVSNAFGDSRADKNVSANAKDRAHSIYSTEASYERRIELKVLKIE